MRSKDEVIRYLEQQSIRAVVCCSVWRWYREGDVFDTPREITILCKATSNQQFWRLANYALCVFQLISHISWLEVYEPGVSSPSFSISLRSCRFWIHPIPCLHVRVLDQSSISPSRESPNPFTFCDPLHCVFYCSICRYFSAIFCEAVSCLSFPHGAALIHFYTVGSTILEILRIIWTDPRFKIRDGSISNSKSRTVLRRTALRS